jgi:hypothetical protein
MLMNYTKEMQRKAIKFYRIMERRWKLFGRILRLPDNVPTYQIMLAYFEDQGKGYEVQNVTSILQTLKNDLLKSICPGAASRACPIIKDT